MKNQRKVFIFIGMPGAGKGTQAAFLANLLAIPHVSTGDILRKRVESNSDDAVELKSIMSMGELVPDSLVNTIVIDFLLSEECKNGCILDGYPRTVSQAEYLQRHAVLNYQVVFFDVDDQIVVQRILGRFNCASCGKLYNKYFDRPKEDGVCDECGNTNFIFRADDDERTIKNRILQYKSQTQPLIDYYNEKAYIHRIDSNRSKEEISAKLCFLVKNI